MVVTCFSSYYEKILATGEIQCIDEDLPFAIPNTWEWVRLRNITSLLGDGIHGTPEYDNNGSYFFINGNNLKEKSIIIKSETKRVNETEYLKYKKELNENTVLVSINGTLGNVAFYNNEPIMLGKSACYFNLLSKQFKSYIYIVLNTPYFLEYALSAATGTTIKNVSLQAMNNLLVPFPSISEQCRIVEKLEQLETYFAKYNKKEKQLSLLNASIHQALKKSVLQEAIQGKLVPQDPNEEPASVLLQRIKEEKLRLVKEGKLRKKDVIDSTIFRGDDNKYYEQIGKHCIDITDCIPFDLPANWSWCRIENYVKLVTDFVASGSFASLRENVKYYKTPNYAILVKAQDFQYDFQKDLTYTDKHGYDFLSGSNLFGGELILSNVGSIGKVFIVPKLDVRMSLAPNSIMVKPIYENQIKWLYNLFNSEFGVQLLYSISSATAIRKFNKTSFKKLIIPIPPIEEQERIVKKIETVFNRIKG